MSNRADAIRTICRLAIDFESSNKSFYQLLDSSGVKDVFPPIAANEVAGELRRDSTLVDAWLDWPADKRTPSGPFFLSNASGFEVGVLTEDGTYSDLEEYDDPIEACAAFIKRELASYLGAS